MNKKQELIRIYKEEIKDSKAGALLDGFMNATPGLNIAWITMNNAIEQSKDMRILRGLELLELFADTKFQENFMKSKQALDGFGLCFEAIVKQRNENKRKIIRDIFLGFINVREDEKEEYEIERLLDILNKITSDEIKYINKIYTISLENTNLSITTSVGIDSGQGEYIDEIYGLVSLGVIYPIESNTIENPYDVEDSINSVMSHFEVSSIGFKFLEYILKEKKNES